MVIAAVTSQAVISSAGEPSTRLISAGTIKMPDPIIEPITMAVAENSPMPCTKCGAEEVVTGVSSPPEAALFADAVAVIGGLFVEGRTVGEVARDFLEVLG